MKIAILFLASCFSALAANAVLGTPAVSPSALASGQVAYTFTVTDSLNADDAWMYVNFAPTNYPYIGACYLQILGWWGIPTSPNVGISVLLMDSGQQPINYAGQTTSNGRCSVTLIAASGTGQWGRVPSTTASVTVAVTFMTSYLSPGASFPIWAEVYGSNAHAPAAQIGNAINPVATIAYLNTTNPGISPNLVQGDYWALHITGQPGSAITMSGTSPGGTINPYTAGYADAYGNFNLSGHNPNVAVGNWVENWTIGGIALPSVNLTVTASGTPVYVTSTDQMYYPETTPVPDDYTGGTITLNALQRRWKTSRGHLEIPRADSIDVGQVTYSKPAAEGGVYRYSYSFDNRQVEMARLGDLDIQDVQAIEWVQPDGWYGVGSAWSPRPLKTAARSSKAEYSVAAKYRPGLIPLHLAGAKVGQYAASEKLTRTELEFAAWHSSIFQNSHTEYVIGPAFKPDATPTAIKKTISRWVSDYGMTFLQPYLDTGNLEDVQPSNQLERDILDCLRAVL